MLEKIVITGGAGFIGSNLAIGLRSKYQDINILCFDNLKRRGSELNLSRLKENSIDFLHGDVRNFEDLSELGSYDLMIECSAEPSVMAGIDSSPSYMLNTNLLGTINCLNSVKKNNSKMIFLSTSRVYPIEFINNLKYIEGDTRFKLQKGQNYPGIFNEGISEDFPLNSIRSLYGTSKLCSELIIEEYCYNYNLESIINRCGLITGPWQMGKVDQGVIVLWVLAHVFDRKLSYIGYKGSGKQVRDFLHVKDLISLIILQIENFDILKNQTYNVGGGLEKSISLLELTEICENVVGKKIEINKIDEERKADLIYYVTNYSKISNIVGWKPEHDIYETVKDIHDWICDNRNAIESLL